MNRRSLLRLLGLAPVAAVGATLAPVAAPVAKITEATPELLIKFSGLSQGVRSKTAFLLSERALIGGSHSHTIAPY